MGEPHGAPHEDLEHPGKPPSDPEPPEHPGSPYDDPEHPQEAPVDPEHPDHVPTPHPEQPPVEPEAQVDAPVEALLGLRDFLSMAPRRRSEAGTAAAFAAMQRWMRLAGHDVNGFYSVPQWQTYYDEAMASTGTPVVR
jgi:hypothetical protein